MDNRKDGKQMLIIKIALGIVLAFFIICIILQPPTIIISYSLIFGVVIIVGAVIYFIIDKLTEPRRKCRSEELWKRFNEHNKNEQSK